MQFHPKILDDREPETEPDGMTFEESLAALDAELARRADKLQDGGEQIR
jgi:hypothetical protein